MGLEGCFKGKTVLITGAGRGIGLAVTEALYAGGAKVYALSKTQEKLAALTEQCPGVIPVLVDLSNWEETRNAVDQLERMDCLINNAGVAEPSPFLEITQENFDKIMSVNLKAVLNVSQAVAKKMVAGGTGGAIVNVSSVAGKQAMATCGSYNCSKAGLEMLTKVMAIELGPHKITVNCVNPAFVETDMSASFIKHQAEKLDKPYEVAKQVVFEAFLASRTPTQQPEMPMQDVVNAILFFASGLTSQITGSNLAIDGGYLIA